MSNILPEAGLIDLLQPGMTVFVGGASGEPKTLRTALMNQPEAARGVRFIGAHLPGINDFDYASLHPTASSIGIFVTPAQRESFVAGKHRLMRMGYLEFANYLSNIEIDVALLLLPEPDHDNRYGMGLNADFTEAVARRARMVVAEVNATLPKTSGARWLPAAQITCQLPSKHFVSHEDKLGENPRIERIAAHVAALVSDGDTLQIGIGKLPSAILQQLQQHRRLGLHSGMISDSCLDLIESGVMTGEDKAIDRGIAVSAGAIGSSRLYSALDRKDIQLREAQYTHHPATMQQLSNLVSINGAIDVDLFGQVNVETVGGKVVSGTGGFGDFLSGAKLSRGGRSIVVLPAQSKSDSRIVPTLCKTSPVSAAANVVDYVVTEFGVASLKGKSLHEIARALIAIASPTVQPELDRAWHAIEAAL